MPLFSWMKWSHEPRVGPVAGDDPLQASGVVPSRVLLKELLWHVEERERSVRELEREQKSAHGAPGGLRWFQKYPRLRTIIPTAELHQLEFLCAQIPPVQAAAVLSRFREVLATNNIRPWELASVFRQVLRDFLSQQEREEGGVSVQPAQYRPMEAWTSRYVMKQGFVTPTVPRCEDGPREEIPTISGYVDRAMRNSGWFASRRDWDLPYYYPVPVRTAGSYGTTL